jgi:hypothetical protein
MTAAERQDDRWDRFHKRQEERMRYEVLHMLYEAADRCADCPVEVGGFVRKLGVWKDEFEKVLRFLTDRNYIELMGEIPRTVAVTVRGIDYLERDCSRRRSIRD